MVTILDGYLSCRVFRDSMLCPFALTPLGLPVVWLGVPEGLRPR